MLWEISLKFLFLILKVALPRRYSTEGPIQLCLLTLHWLVAICRSILQPLLKPRFHLRPLPPVQNIINCLRGSSPRCPNSRPPSLSQLSRSRRPSNNVWTFSLQICNVLNQSYYLYLNTQSGLKLETWQKQMCSRIIDISVTKPLADCCCTSGIQLLTHTAAAQRRPVKSRGIETNSCSYSSRPPRRFYYCTYRSLFGSMNISRMPSVCALLY